MLEDIKLILDSNVTPAAALVVVVLLLRPILATLTSGWIEDRRAQRRLESDRNDNERAQTATLRQLGDQLDLSLVTQRQIAELIGQLAVMPGRLDSAVQQMVERSGQRDLVLAGHTASLSAIQAGVGDGKGEAWAEDGPRLRAIQGMLSGALTSIEERIVRRLDPTRPDARAIVREEVQAAIKELKRKGTGPLPPLEEVLGTPPQGDVSQSTDETPAKGKESTT